MEDSKAIKLSQRGSNGRFAKNGFFYFHQMKQKQLDMNKKFFSHPILGGIRKKALDVFLATMSKLIDLDTEGKSPK